MTNSCSGRKSDKPIQKWSRKAKILGYLERLESHPPFSRCADRCTSVTVNLLFNRPVQGLRDKHVPKNLWNLLRLKFTYLKNIL